MHACMNYNYAIVITRTNSLYAFSPSDRLEELQRVLRDTDIPLDAIEVGRCHVPSTDYCLLSDVHVYMCVYVCTL